MICVVLPLQVRNGMGRSAKSGKVFFRTRSPKDVWAKVNKWAGRLKEKVEKECLYLVPPFNKSRNAFLWWSFEAWVCTCVFIAKDRLHVQTLLTHCSGCCFSWQKFSSCERKTLTLLSIVNCVYIDRFCLYTWCWRGCLDQLQTCGMKNHSFQAVGQAFLIVNNPWFCLLTLELARVST